MDPSYLIGGVPKDLPRGCALTKGEVFVGEGDEYDSAFFDKRPKFLHYLPDIAIIGNIEYDHADIYPDLDAIRPIHLRRLGHGFRSDRHALPLRRDPERNPRGDRRR